MGAVLFGQEQTSSIHVAPRDVRMDVDAAGHNDEAIGIDCFVGPDVARRLRDDSVVADEKVSDFVAAVRWIDEAAALDMDQHAAALET